MHRAPSAASPSFRTGYAGTVVITPVDRLSRLSSDALLTALGIPGPEGSIYELALTHRSHAFEQGESVHNERLEFLGDAVLGLIVTTLAYERFPDMTEGELARLRASVVNTQALADLARECGLGEHIRLGRGEEASGGKDKASLLANTFEAVIGAAYLDRGMAGLTEVIAPTLLDRLENTVAQGGGHDSKTELQEVVVRDFNTRPVYRVASSGPDHDKRFTAHVYIDDELYGAGTGRSKKEAEQESAREALDRLSAEPQPVIEGARDARAS